MWSAWLCVKTAAWTRSTCSRRSCNRNSGGVSIRKFPSGAGTKTPVRVRWLRGFVDLQTGQRQPITGTPTLVPVPSRISSRLKRALHAVEVALDLPPNVAERFGLPHADGDDKIAAGDADGQLGPQFDPQSR